MPTFTLLKSILSVFLFLAWFCTVQGYDLTQNGKVVAKVEGNFMWNVTLGNETTKISLPATGVNVSGHQIPRVTLMVLSWKVVDSQNSSLHYVSTFVFNKDINEVSLSKCVLQITDTNNPASSKNVTWDVNEVLVTNPALAYACSSLNAKNSDGDVISIQNAHLQPFDLKNGTFGEDFVCAKDKTTTAPSTTTVAPVPKRTAGNWTVTQNGYSCIRFIGEITLKLDYVMQNGSNATALVTVPATSTVNQTVSSCGYNATAGRIVTNEQILQLDFTVNSFPWFLTLNFTNDSVLVHDSAASHPTSAYYARLRYVVDGQTFSNASNLNDEITLANQVNKTTGAGALSMFKSDPNHYYRCNSAETHAVVKGFEVQTKNLRAQAFLQNSTKMTHENICLTDQQNEASDLVPIITGAALATLVVFVLIVYLVGRARARANTYETI